MRLVAGLPGRHKRIFLGLLMNEIRASASTADAIGRHSSIRREPRESGSWASREMVVGAV
jgi:hypothetical protein